MVYSVMVRKHAPMEAVKMVRLQPVPASALTLLVPVSIVCPIMIVVMEWHVRLIFARPLLDYVLAVPTTWNAIMAAFVLQRLVMLLLVASQHPILVQVQLRSATRF